MVGNDADTNNSPSQNNNINSSSEYLKFAAEAQARGEVVLAMHLYLVAYERSVQQSVTPDKRVIEGLREAWILACKAKERSLAEYILEKLQPYLSGEEISQYATKLQHLALDRLEEFGVSREDLEDMTNIISQGLFGMDANSMIMFVEQSMSKNNLFSEMQRGLIKDRKKEEPAAPDARAVENSSDAVDSETLAEKSTEIPSFTEITPELAETNEKDTHIDQMAESVFGGMKAAGPLSSPFSLAGFGMGNPEVEGEPYEVLTYKDLVGYGRAIETMRNHGIGIQSEESFKQLIETLNEKHGLTRMPITGVYLFRSPVREDANQFMLATMGEINQPVIRMRMEENFQGMPVLCVMASSEQQPRFNTIRSSIDNGGVLILEDIDLWALPMMESIVEESNNFFHAQLSRGAREAMIFIKAAIENPNVYVLMSASHEYNIEPFLFDFMPPITVIDIDLPDDQERTELWINILSEHPSLSGVDLGTLVTYSARMSRYDIYMAAREAVEDAYKASLAEKEYVPVTTADIFERIAAYQPLESSEYRQLENAIVEAFSHDLDSLDEYLKGESE